MPFFPEPPAREDKPDFSALPSHLLLRIEEMLGEKIISAQTAYGGFSASASFVLTLSSGRKIFAKGTHPAEMSHGAETLRQEIFAYQNLPILAKVAPRLIGAATDGDDSGWMLGLWECLIPSLPPSDVVVEKIIDALDLFQQDPATVLPSARQKNYISLFFQDDKKWRRLHGEPATRDKFLDLFVDSAMAATWFEKNIDMLLSLQASVPSLAGEESLVHGDLRLDNFLFSSDRVYVIDWPNACRGPRVFDDCFLFANLESLGHGRIEDLFALHEASGGRRPAPEDRCVMMTAICGYFADQAYRAVPPKMPRLRWMQKSMLAAGLGFLARQGKIESIPVMKNENAR